MAQSIDRCKVSNLHRIAVAIAFAPAVLPEIALATDHDHDSRPLILFRGGSAWEKPR
jgi:hypothetical protein